MMFGCCRRLPLLGLRRNANASKDSTGERLEVLASLGASSGRERIRQASKAIRECRATPSHDLHDMDSPWMENLLRALLLDENLELPTPSENGKITSYYRSGGSQHQSAGSSNVNEPRLYAVALLLCLAASDDNKQIILATSWAMDAIGLLVRGESTGSEVFLVVLKMLCEIVQIRATRARLFQLEWVPELLERALEHDPSNTEVRPVALTTLSFIALAEETRTSIMRRPRLVNFVSAIASGEEPVGSPNRAEAMTILEQLAEAKDNRVDMLKTPAVLAAAKHCIETEPLGSEIRVAAFRLLQNLATARENKNELVKTAWVLPLAKRVLREEPIGSDVKAKAFGMLWSLALSRRNQVDLYQSRWLMELSEKALAKESQGSPVKVNVCGLIWNLCALEQNKVDIYANRRLMDLLVERCVLGERPGSEVRANALGALSELAVADENKRAMLQDTKMMAAIERVLKEEPRGTGDNESCAYSFALLWNLALSRLNQVDLFKMDWVLEHAEVVLRDEPSHSEAKANALAMLWNLAVANENKQAMFDRRWVLEHAMLSVQAYTVGKNDEVCANALGLLQNLAGTNKNQIAMLSSVPALPDMCRKVLDRLLFFSAIPAATISNSNNLNGTQPIATPKSASGRFIPGGVYSFGGSMLSQQQVEVVVNCLGLIQNLAFAEENKRAVFQWSWLGVALHRVVQDAPAGSEIKANAFGVLWNLAADRENQRAMLESDGWTWLFPTIERVFREELIGSSVKMFALGTVRELLSGPGEDILRQRGRVTWLAETAERVLRDEPVGSESKTSVLGMLQDLTRREDCPRMQILLSLAEQLIKEETNTSPVKLEATQWLVCLSRRDGQSALRLVETYPSVLYSALRCFLEEDIVHAPLAAAVDTLMFWLAKHPSSRMMALASAPNLLVIMQTRLRKTQCQSATLLLAYGMFCSEPAARLPPLSSSAKITRSIEVLTEALNNDGVSSPQNDLADVLEMLTGLTRESAFCRHIKTGLEPLLHRAEAQLLENKVEPASEAGGDAAAQAKREVCLERVRLLKERMLNTQALQDSQQFLIGKRTDEDMQTSLVDSTHEHASSDFAPLLELPPNESSAKAAPATAEQGTEHQPDDSPNAHSSDSANNNKNDEMGVNHGSSSSMSVSSNQTAHGATPPKEKNVTMMAASAQPRGIS